ncbi:putative outer membrane starch-binding protein [Mucilaginibacter gracilis]|uniref:RagB/SusD domain-containing protein n=2 Tax=Mucilaginibacter TaxID=423349 RepID=H1YIH4_9SPHI|nr:MULTISPECIES: RagB/SusD family nutrient uptake outer membrane protein [Mucilaginibacter]EHQ26540.1 RagB/SusD domain-containing protein [Mucilaginibacter paludis DSM 18603]RKR80479.1 putative outer membrane starch-binding protein [Mucilaginibacter gracilis]
MKSKYLLTYTIVLVLFATSCRKFLDQTPVSTPTDATTWQADGDANTGVAACYSLIRAAFNASIGYYAYGDLASGEFSNSDQPDFQKVIDFNLGAGVASTATDNPLLKLRLWTPFFTAVAQSNRAIAFITAMPTAVFNGTSDAEKLARKNKYLGEAYFTRAFCYFTMARIWGDVPLVLENTDATVAQQYARSPQGDVLKQAIVDVNLAIQYLDWKDNGSSDRVVRADKGAAYALLAHIDAWKGDYAGCNTACDAVINSGTYSLTAAASFMDIYKGQSPESIFEIAQNTLSEGYNANVSLTLASQTLTAPYLNGTVPVWHINNSYVTKLYTDTADVRLKKGFISVSSGATSFLECVKYTNIQTVNNNVTLKVALNNIVIFRLADIELLKAEALSSGPSGDYNTALSLINQVRRARNAKALTGLSGTAVIQAVTDERGRELFLEGHRTFDLIRLERITKDQQFDNVTPGEFAAGKTYWPIDPNLFLNNSKITQTPFWIGKVN